MAAGIPHLGKALGLSQLEPDIFFAYCEDFEIDKLTNNIFIHVMKICIIDNDAQIKW